MGDVVFETFLSDSDVRHCKKKSSHWPRLRYISVYLGFHSISTLLNPINMAVWSIINRKSHDAF